mgnify:CR=1 FL=1
MSLFSFLTQTSNTFEDKKSYENVILLLRRHWFVIAMKFFAFIFIGLIPIALGIFFSGNPYFWVGAVIFYLFWWYGVFYAITMYLLDVWIVTDHRIIDSEQHGFFSRTVAELHLAKIQDVSVSIAGLVPTFLNFGNLEVQTAGTQEKFFFKQIPNPERVKDIIMEAHNQFIRSHPNDVEIHEASSNIIAP